MANSIAFTSEALLLLWLLNRKFPGLLTMGSTLWRTLLVSLLAGGGVYLVLHLPLVAGLSTIWSAVAAAGLMGLAFLVVIPFIIPEIKLLFRLGEGQA